VDESDLESCRVVELNITLCYTIALQHLRVGWTEYCDILLESRNSEVKEDDYC
jgi:hypothetical protein